MAIQGTMHKILHNTQNTENTETIMMAGGSIKNDANLTVSYDLFVSVPISRILRFREDLFPALSARTESIEVVCCG